MRLACWPKGKNRKDNLLKAVYFYSSLLKINILPDLSLFSLLSFFTKLEPFLKLL
ncbi:hypothetical protein ADIARSV_1677 [Arcticibacter svalbardensis MN12-7]|uniref:Uncharacterized protein n=1 Tax=Arcticibacter svalbardensis MN12-7 TaxID=1150600 RepID=R9H1X5_9SPHI|nr:hypothetical protein ADIARSV_1677 [Arcticibacter svalbardensis MN12-7]